MTTQQKTLESIAQKHLGLGTLTTRNRDRLDFHDLAVWSIDAALKAAFEAGKQAACNGCKGRCQMSAARAEYAQRQTEAHLLVERLSKALDQHAKKARSQPWNRAIACDLGACNERLLDALGRLGALTEEELQNQR